MKFFFIIWEFFCIFVHTIKELTMDNKSFKLKQAVDEYAVDTKRLSELLFPELSYPMRALTRLMSGESELTIGQFKSFSDLVRVKPSELLEKFYN